MTTFNTGNPLGSTDVYDRYDNSENLDNFSNGQLDAYADRLGVMRLSMQGIRNASQYVDIGPYAAGLVFTSRNQVFSYDAGSGAEYYAPGPAIVLPYTTTGVGAAEIANFRSVGDAVLRQDLAIVDSIAQLPTRKQDALPFTVLGYHAGYVTGGGSFAWDSTAPRSLHDGWRVFSPTVPTDGLTTAGADVVSYMAGTGETSPAASGCFVRLWDGEAQLEFCGVVPGVDCGLPAQQMLTDCAIGGISVRCDIELTSSTPLAVSQYRTDPPVFRDFNKSNLTLRQLTYTGTSGSAISALSPAASVKVTRLIGPGADAGLTSGLLLGGLGDAHHYVGWVGGFNNGINFENAYSVTVNVGWVEDCIRGVRINGNQNQVLGGHIGGSFVEAEISPTSCEVGIAILPGSASNWIKSNVEYCRRSSSARGINDQGAGTRFDGYTESCADYNIFAQGKDGVFNVLAGGTNVELERSGYFAGPSNTISLLTQTDYIDETIDGTNSTLTFAYLQEFASSFNGVIEGPHGLGQSAGFPVTTANILTDSNNLLAGSWDSSALGVASWGAVTSTLSGVSAAELNWQQTTKLTFPALAGSGDIYRKTKASLSVTTGSLSIGAFVRVESGSLDVMVRVVTGATQTRHVISLGPSTNFTRIGTDSIYSGAPVADAVYEISFRSYGGAVAYIGGAYVMAVPEVVAPAWNGAAVRQIIGSTPVGGDCFYNGLAVNGALRNAVGSITGTITLDASTIVYPCYLVSASGSPYNIILGGAAEGTEVVLKRDGTAGTVNVLVSSTLDGSAASTPFTTAYSILRVIFTGGAWYKV